MEEIKVAEGSAEAIEMRTAFAEAADRASESRKRLGSSEGVVGGEPMKDGD